MENVLEKMERIGADKRMADFNRDENGLLYTTKAQRTGCSMCGFGIHMEQRPHRFDLLLDRNPKEWDFWMNRCCTDENGNPYGWGRVLDYIGVEWRPIPNVEQLTWSDVT